MANFRPTNLTCFLLCIACACCRAVSSFTPASPSISTPAATSSVEVRNGESLLVIAPHPDDETLGAAGLMQEVLRRGGRVRVVLVTAGDGYVEAVVHETGELRPRPAEYVAYGERRLRETRAALDALGGGHIELELLGFPDGGLAPLLRAHWLALHPEHSPTTGATDPPYDEAVEPDAPYSGTNLRAELVRQLRETAPTLIVLPEPRDKHPDHRAAGLFTLLALGDWSPTAPLPRLLAYLVHWPGWPQGWDAATPSAAADGDLLTLPPTFPMRHHSAVFFELDDAEMTAKRATLTRYRSQQHEMPSFLAAFARRTEPFVVLGPHDLRHVGRLVER